MLPIEQHPDFSNIGTHLKHGKESDSMVSSNNDDNEDDNNDNDNLGNNQSDHDDYFSSSTFHVDELPAGSSAFSGFV
jgi:hypothetical protein